MPHSRTKYPAAIHLFFRRDGQVLLLRRCNTGDEDGNYSVVAGHVDQGESVVQAAIREAKEEIGVQITRPDLAMCGVMHRKASDERIDFFANITSWQGAIRNLEPHKCDELIWCDSDALPENTISYVRKALSFPADGFWYDEFGW